MGRKPKRAVDVLDYHLRQGRIQRIRRGLYIHPKSIDPWAIAAKLADPVVISHDGALSFHKLTGLGHRISFMTTARTSRTVFGDVIYQSIRVKELPSYRFTEEHEREGCKVRVTKVAATLVDCLALLERAPEPSELLEVFQAVKKTIKASQLIDYAVSLGNRLVVSRLAFYLTCAGFDLMNEELGTLFEKGVQVPTYFERKRRTKRDSIVSKWKLIVPPPLQTIWLDTVG